MSEDRSTQAYPALVRFGGDMDTQVRGDVVPFSEGLDGALVPVAGEAEVMVCLSADMVISQMLIECFCVFKVFVAFVPLADVLV
jgi:hypothetical protein